MNLIIPILFLFDNISYLPYSYQNELNFMIIFLIYECIVHTLYTHIPAVRAHIRINNFSSLFYILWYVSSYFITAVGGYCLQSIWPRSIITHASVAWNDNKMSISVCECEPVIFFFLFHFHYYYHYYYYSFRWIAFHGKLQNWPSSYFL